jgi:hypothetical protein
MQDYYLVVEGIAFEQLLRFLPIALNGILLVAENKSIGSNNL